MSASAAPIRHSEALLISWQLARREARHLRSMELEPEHLFLGLLKLAELDADAVLAESTQLTGPQIKQEARFVQNLARCWEKAGIATTHVRHRLRDALPTGEAGDKDKPGQRRSQLCREVFAKAEQDAAESDSECVQPLHLLAGVLDVASPSVLTALDAAGVAEETLGDAVAACLRESEDESGVAQEKKEEKDDEEEKPADPDKVARRLVNRIGRDLSALAQKGQLPPVIGRKEEMRALVQALIRSRKNNIILIGEAGVGKTGIVEGLAQRIARGEVPLDFVNKRIIEISMGDLVAGTHYRGDMEARLQILIAEARRDPDLILFIDEIHLMAGAGKTSGGAMDAANILKPALARGDIRVIGATTTQEYRRYIETDAALARRFEVLEVLEPDRADTLAILQGLRPNMEKHHGVKMEDAALTAAIDLTLRHLPAQRLPDKAIDVLDRACAQARMKSLSADFRAQLEAGLVITAKDIAAAVAQRCKVPVGEIGDEDSARLLRLEEDLEKKVKGQRKAIRVVSEAIRLARSGLKQGGRPVGVFLFAGPSGTGKTELAKTLAACLFGNERQLIRIDMSELMEEHSVSKLIGSPPGFVGYAQGGQLTEQVRSQPYSVVLLDEVEKAHPKIMDLFLQVFDNGFLTDSHGVKCDFRETLIILTSNVGAGQRKAAMGFLPAAPGDEAAELEKAVIAAARKLFRPEFLNRLTDTVVFLPLGQEEVRQILALNIARLNERLRPKNLSLRLTAEAENLLISQGCSPEYGARHLERTVEKLVGKPLAEVILAGRHGPGTIIEGTVQDGALRLRKLPAA